MKVLLVNPDVPDTFWSLKNALNFISKKSILPALGLLTVKIRMESNPLDRLQVSKFRGNISPETIPVFGTAQNNMFTGYVLSSLKNVLGMNEKRDTI
ncbi:hypothetical protein ACFL5Z_05725 [Planctomycetota bacterium]